MIRPSFRALAATMSLSAPLAGCTVGPNYERPQVLSAGSVPVRRRPAQAQSLADAPWFEVFQDPDAPGADQGSARQQSRPAGGAGPGRGGARPGRHREVVLLPAGGRAAQRRLARVVAATTTLEPSRSPRTSNYGFRLSWEIDLFGKLRRQREAALAIALRQRAEPARRAGHADRRRRVHLLPAARARSAARNRSADPGAERRDGRLLQEPARRRRLEPPRGGPHRRQPRADRGRDSGHRAAAGLAENLLSFLLGRGTGTDHAAGAAAGRKPAAAGTARSAGAAARAAPRRRARRAAARRGQRRHRRGQGAVLPHASASPAFSAASTAISPASSVAAARCGRSRPACCSRSSMRDG